MSCIWVIEKTRDANEGASCAAALMGDFPVRLIASANSFVHLIKLKQNLKPNVLIVDLDDCQLNVQRAESLFDYYMPRAMRIYLCRDSLSGDAHFIHTKNLTFVQKPIEALQLSKLVRKLLRKPVGAQARYSMQFKDLLFDQSRLEFAIAGSNQSEKLPLKEAQILKLLIEKKGHCLSRQDIKEEIWHDLTVSARTIDSHVSRLRKRLGNAEISIESVYGGGYLLK